jgi:hypothetical protein
MGVVVVVGCCLIMRREVLAILVSACSASDGSTKYRVGVRGH